MTTTVLTLAVALTMAGPETAADVVTLRDGTIVSGQIVEPAPRGPLRMVVRRAWAEANVPELAKRWEAEALPALKNARKQRRERLDAWKRDRAGTAPEDPITGWIDRERDRLADKDAKDEAPLMVVTINRANVKGTTHRPQATARLLRLGWRSGFKNVETLPLDALKDALEGRGFNPAGTEPVGLDALLPLQPETEAQWRVRRAATEVSYDSGLKFLRFQDLMVPEPAPGQALGPEVAVSALAGLSKLLTGEANDAPSDGFRALATRGKMGAIVTRQDLGADLDSAAVEIALWVRGPDQRWAPAFTRSATVRAGDLKPNEGDDLALDPQVQAAFSALQAFGLGDVDPQIKRKSLNVGALTRKALAQARTAFQTELAGLALPLENTGRQQE